MDTEEKTIDDILDEFNETADKEAEEAEEADSDGVQTPDEPPVTEGEEPEVNTETDAESDSESDAGADAEQTQNAEPAKGVTEEPLSGDSTEEAEEVPPAAEPATSATEPVTGTTEQAKDDKGEDTLANRLSQDIDEYNRLYPESPVKSISEIPDAVRFARLREAGATVEEAAMIVNRKATITEARKAGATAEREKSAGKAHLTASAPKPASGASELRMTEQELEDARNALGDELSDEEIEKLYRRVNK